MRPSPAPGRARIDDADGPACLGPARCAGEPIRAMPRSPAQGRISGPAVSAEPAAGPAATRLCRSTPLSKLSLCRLGAFILVLGLHGHPAQCSPRTARARGRTVGCGSRPSGPAPDQALIRPGPSAPCEPPLGHVRTAPAAHVPPGLLSLKCSRPPVSAHVPQRLLTSPSASSRPPAPAHVPQRLLTSLKACSRPPASALPAPPHAQSPRPLSAWAPCALRRLGSGRRHPCKARHGMQGPSALRSRFWWRAQLAVFLMRPAPRLQTLLRQVPPAH